MGEKISFIDLFGTELELEDEYAREMLADESAARAEDVAVLEARMDTFTALPAGSTAGDAELMDIRVGADGVTYANAGSAVREQIAPLNAMNFSQINLPTPENAWIRYSNGEKVASNATRLYIFNDNLPKYIKAFLTSDTNALCAIAFYNSKTIGTDSYMASESVDFASGLHNDGYWYQTEVPSGAVSIAITTKVPSDSVASPQIIFDNSTIMTMNLNNLLSYGERTLVFDSTLADAPYFVYNKPIEKGLYYLETTKADETKIIHFKGYEATEGLIYLRYIANNTEKLFLYFPVQLSRIEITCSPYTYNNENIKLYKIGTGEALSDPVQNVNLKAGAVPLGNVTKGTWGVGGLLNHADRLAAGLYKCSGLFTVSLADYTNYKYAFIMYKDDGTTRLYDSGWKTQDDVFYCDNNSVFGITLASTGNTALVPSDIDAIGLSITSNAYIDKSDVMVERELATLKNVVDNLDIDDMADNKTRSNLAVFTGRFKPCYDHLFVNKTGDNVIIPHESLYHVRLSRRLGYNTIEANVYPTSDGKYIVNHLNGGKFGGYFHHVDGETDISNIDVSTVTWAWIEENVRYNSTIPKYRTRPCLLEEFLGECRQQNIIPFLGRANDAAVVAIANEIMGVDNYIAYGGNRTLSPSAPIYQWNSSLTTKADILAYCDTYGAPFIYGMGNTSAFTDEELSDIVGTLHEHGYYIGTSYADYKWYKFQTLGFDFNGTQALANRIDVGNLHNINSIFGFDGFTYSAATETNGVLEFATAGTIVPNIPDTTYELCVIDIEVWFNGQIELRGIGDIVATDYNSDGTCPFYMSIPIVNGSPKFLIIAKANTTVYDIKYKASVF